MPLIVAAAEESTDLTWSSEDHDDGVRTNGPCAPPLHAENALLLDRNATSLVNSQLSLMEQEYRTCLTSVRRQNKTNSNGRPSLSSKQVEDVAAAVRFRLELERYERVASADAANMWSRRDATEGAFSPVISVHLVDWSPGITKSRLTRARDSQSVMKSKQQRQPPSSLPSREISYDPVEGRTAEMDPRQHFRSPSEKLEGVRSNLGLRRSKTVAVHLAARYGFLDEIEHRSKQIRESLIPPVPPLDTRIFSQMESAARSDLPSPFSLEEISREQTSQTGPEAAETIVPRQLLSHPWVPTTTWDPDWNEEYPLLPNDAPDLNPVRQPDLPQESRRGDLKRSRSIFRWLQRRSELDELIELYMNDAQIDAMTLEKKLSKPRWAALWPIRNFRDPAVFTSTAFSSKL